MALTLAEQRNLPGYEVLKNAGILTRHRTARAVTLTK